MESVVTNIEVMGLESSVKASKYPMNVDLEKLDCEVTKTVTKLGHMESGHDQFLTGIRVNFDLTFSIKAWVEAERYRFLEFVSSQSTMHRLTKMSIHKQCNEYVHPIVSSWSLKFVNDYLKLQAVRENIYEGCPYFNNNEYNITTVQEYHNILKEAYLVALYNVPVGLTYTARMTTNYRCLKNIYKQRKTHKLPEWRQFCSDIEELPRFKELCL